LCVCLTIGLVAAGRAAAQSSPTPGVDCGGALLPPCPDNASYPQPDASMDPNRYGQNASRNSPQTQQNGNTTYVDTAGGDAAQRASRDNQNQLFPPDPVTDFQRLAKSSTGEMLPIFGRDFFKQVPSTFAPGDQLSVTPDYVIGPGDDVLLRFWGPETFNSQLTVDRSGSIYVPKVGSIHVAGLRFDELQKQITTELSRTYRNFNVSVNLGRLRSIQIYVVGEARRPGAYTISALSTVLNGLFASGGPNVQGSLRRIQVRRGTETISVFDLYDLVLRGDKSKDVRLEQGDTIFIPPVGPQVALAGSVRHPAIYELAPQSTLSDILTIAGGFSAIALSNQVSLERVEQDNVRRAFTVAVDKAGGGMPLHDGDVIYAGHISAGYEKSVTIRGNLANPGRFSWHEGMRLSDIIPDRSSLLTNDYWRERNRLGVPVPLFEPLPNPQPLPYSSTGYGPRGQTPNNAFAPSADQNQQNPSNIGYPYGQYPQDPYQENQPGLADQVGLATSGIQVQNPQGSDRSDGTSANYPQQNGNSPLNPSAQQLRPQYGTDEQQRPPAQNKIRIPAPEIDWSYAVIERLDPETLKTSLIPFNLGKLVQDHDASQNLVLQPGDVVTIVSQNDISVPQGLRTKYVRLEGEFQGAGVYSVLPGEKLEQLVQRAGGLTDKAYLYGSSFSRESARVYQQQRLDEYIATLSADMERSSAVRAASSSTGIMDPSSLAAERNLVNQLRQMRATGRVVLDFVPASIGVASIPDIPLENGDVFRVPSRPDTVSVIGAVYGQNVFLYKPNRRLRDYVGLAGSPNRIADSKHAFIIRADGSVFSRERAQGVWSNNFDNATINPGDAIVIPEKLIKPSALKELIDYAQIASSFGLAAAEIAILR
jgi:protein involved in polysaccharide export with SLBB domain